MKTQHYLLLAILATIAIHASTSITDTTITVTDTVIYDTAYYTTDGTNWQPLSLNGDTQRGAWYIAQATGTIPDDTQRVATYSCTWNTGWDCDGNQWQITNRNATPPNTTQPDEPVPGQPWSDPATWPDGTVPTQGEHVTITEDMNVTLDTNPPPLDHIEIQGGNLAFARQDISLTTGLITIHDQGTLSIGTKTLPFNHKAQITLTGQRSDLPGEGHCGVKGICSMGGKLSLHGAVKGPTWTKLDQTANVGDTTIHLKENVEWEPGDEIVIVSTDYDPGQAEQRTITAVNGDRVTLNESLDFMHYGEIYEQAGYSVDQRAEVMHLTRNIVIQGDEQSEDDNFGGHVMAHNEHHMEQKNRADNGEEYVDLWQTMENDKRLVPEISGVEFKRMGQTGILARYPFHWHKYGNASGSYIEDSSIHDSYQRCTTIHGTQGLRVENNVAFNIIGHCYFLEDGTEWDNLLKDNVGAVIKHFPRPSQRLIETDDRPSVYWWSNADNDFIGNVAAGAFGYGFWLTPKYHPTGETATESINLRTVSSFGTYEDNVVHSTTFERIQAVEEANWYPPVGTGGQGGVGFMIGEPRPGKQFKPRGIECSRHWDYFDADAILCDFVNITAYYNHLGGKFQGVHSYVRPVNSTFADNQNDLFTDLANHEENVVLFAHTDNTGNPGRWGDGMVPIVEGATQSDRSAINQLSQQAGRSLSWEYNIGPDTETIRQWGLNWKYDGGNTKGAVFIDYEDTDIFNRGGNAVPTIAHQMLMYDSTVINSEPYLPHGPDKFPVRTTIRDVDGTLTGTGTYTEIREQAYRNDMNEDPEVFYDDTCEPAPDGENYQICTGMSGRANVEVDGREARITDQQTGGTITAKAFIPTNRTYTVETEGVSQASFNNVRIHQEQTLTYILPNTGPFSENAGGYNYKGDVVEVNTMNEFEASDHVATIYHDATTNTQYVKLRGMADIKSPFHYGRCVPRDENNYRTCSPWRAYFISFTTE
jgi:hypothetical protein